MSVFGRIQLNLNFFEQKYTRGGVLCAWMNDRYPTLVKIYYSINNKFILIVLDDVNKLLLTE